MTSATTGGLATLACLLRSPRFHGQVIIGVIGLSALAGLARETGSRLRTPGRRGQGEEAVVTCHPIPGDRSGSARCAARSRTSR